MTNDCLDIGRPGERELPPERSPARTTGWFGLLGRCRWGTGWASPNAECRRGGFECIKKLSLGNLVMLRRCVELFWELISRHFDEVSERAWEAKQRSDEARALQVEGGQRQQGNSVSPWRPTSF